MGLLPLFADEDLLPAIREALKRLQVAQDHYDQACASIDGQYLRGLDGKGEMAAAQAAAVRHEF